MKRRLLFSAFLFCALHSSVWPYSLEQKINQLLIISADLAEIPGKMDAIKSCVGGIQLQWGAYSLQKTRTAAGAAAELAVESGCPPLFIAADYEGGSVYAPTTLGLLALPTNMMLGAADDEKETAALFYLAGRELKRAGINMAFGPVLDINTNRQNPIIGIRSISDDPLLTSEIGEAVINGFEAARIITTPKHFPGHGDTGADSHLTLPEVGTSREDIFKKHILPFRRALAGGAPAVMTAHVLYKNLDSATCATLSPRIITGVLKEKMGFGGAVITDSLDMKAITRKHSIPEAALKALKAGADILLIGKGNYRKVAAAIGKAARNDAALRKRIEDAFSRIAEIKKKYGLGKRKTDNSRFDMAYMDISRKLSEKAVTMLKNEGMIPLPKDKKIAAFFFSPQRFDADTIVFYRGMLKRGYKLTQYKYGISPDGKDTAEILSALPEYDIVVIGGFQWAARQNAGQKKAIEKILSAGKPSIAISLMSPYDATNYKKAGAVMAIYGITDFSMEAAAKVLAGEIPAAGKLPVKIPGFPENSKSR